MLPFNPNELKSDKLPFLQNLILPTLSPSQTSKLIKARTYIAELNGYCVALPNPFLVLSPSVIKESLASSEIENIQTTLVEALQNALFPSVEQRQHDKEVLRYREAIMWGYKQIQDGLPIISRVVTGVQNELIPSSKLQYRTNQNVIWNPSTKEILLVPPKSIDLPELIKDWEIFVNQADESLDPLIKIAIAHYQFESIHPFDDGNGRTGRILMVLDLIRSKLLELPVLYLSGYIAKNKSRYYEGLQSVRKTNNWDLYIDFMLDVFLEQAIETKKVFVQIMQLFQTQKIELKTNLPKIYSRELLEAIFISPVLTPVSLGNSLGIHYTTASRYLKQLETLGTLVNQKIGKNQFYTNIELIKILS